MWVESPQDFLVICERHRRVLPAEAAKAILVVGPRAACMECNGFDSDRFALLVPTVLLDEPRRDA